MAFFFLLLSRRRECVRVISCLSKWVGDGCLCFFFFVKPISQDSCQIMFWLNIIEYSSHAEYGDIGQAWALRPTRSKNSLLLSSTRLWCLSSLRSMRPLLDLWSHQLTFLRSSCRCSGILLLLTVMTPLRLGDYPEGPACRSGGRCVYVYVYICLWQVWSFRWFPLSLWCAWFLGKARIFSPELQNKEHPAMQGLPSQHEVRDHNISIFFNVVVLALMTDSLVSLHIKPCWVNHVVWYWRNPAHRACYGHSASSRGQQDLCLCYVSCHLSPPFLRSHLLCTSSSLHTLWSLPHHRILIVLDQSIPPRGSLAGDLYSLLDDPSGDIEFVCPDGLVHVCTD